MTRVRQVLEKRHTICRAALGVGILYGGVAGALYVSLPALLNGVGVGAVPAVLIGALLGMAVGAIGGGVAGVMGIVARSRWAWCLAGAMGGFIPAALIRLIGLMLELEEPGEVDRLLLQTLAVVPVLTGGLLGLAVGRGLRSGRSDVPGVKTLVEKIQRADALEPALPRSGFPAEVTPAATPEGRGDEAAPVILRGSGKNDGEELRASP